VGGRCAAVLGRRTPDGGRARIATLAGGTASPASGRGSTGTRQVPTCQLPSPSAEPARFRQGQPEGPSGASAKRALTGSCGAAPSLVCRRHDPKSLDRRALDRRRGDDCCATILVRLQQVDPEAGINIAAVGSGTPEEVLRGNVAGARYAAFRASVATACRSAAAPIAHPAC
jgi:hypothetical protein